MRGAPDIACICVEFGEESKAAVLRSVNWCRPSRKNVAPWTIGAAVVALAVIAVVEMVSSTRSDTEPPGPLEPGDAGAPAALQQCGDCHMVFLSRMLPSRSWAATLSTMDDHFGEDAAIPKTTWTKSAIS